MERSFETEMSRRRFVAVAGGAFAGAVILGGCGHRHQVLGAEGEPPVTIGSIDGAIDSTGLKPGVRGGQMQVTDTLPPPAFWYPGQFVTSVATDQPHYAGTIDDGPSPYNTDPILFAADRNNVKLTFFIIGMMLRAFPEIGARIRDAGHQIGNHSVYHNPYTAVGLAPQVPANQQIIHEILGVTSTVSRAPGLTEGAVYMEAVRESGLYEVHTAWSTTDSLAPRVGVEVILAEHKRGLKRGGIEINHDGGNKRPTPDAYESMLEYCDQVGITSVTMDQLMSEGTGLPASGRYTHTNTLPGYEATPPQNVCNFDVYSELTGILENFSLKRAQRSRVVEVLAELDSLAA